MIRREFLYVATWIVFLLLKGVDYPGNSVFFVLVTIALCVFYLISSFKIFKRKKGRESIVPALAGLAIVTSLITIPFSIFLRNWEWLSYLPFINIIFSTILLGIIGTKRIRKQKIEQVYQSTFLRTLLVLIITSFFAFRPIKISFYRQSIIFLNAGHEDIQSNMIAVDLGEKTDEELSKGNCDRAIELALKSYEESLKWLGIYNDTLTEYNVSQLWMIQGAYTNVYDAYNCKAEKLYDSKNYSNALYFKIKADSFLNINPVARNDWWRNERATSKNDIGLCYDKLHQNDSAAIYFMKAAKYHSDTIKIQNVNLATYYNNLARSLAREQYWSESSQVAKQSILVLDKDSISEDKNNSYTRSYLRLVYNSLAENKLQEAEKYLSNIKNYLTPTKEGEYYLYQAILANSLENPLQAVNYAEKAKKLFIDLAGEKNPNVATCYTILFDAWMSIPDYDSAYINIQRGKEIAKENYSINSAKYAEFTNKEAYYLFLTGHYLESLDKFLDVKIAF